MILDPPVRSESDVARRTSYLVGAAVNAVVLYLVNVEPGWQAVPFLTEDTTQVLDMVNVTLCAGALAQLVYLFVDPPWFKTLGDLVTTGIGLATLVLVFRVFPFSFDGAIPW